MGNIMPIEELLPKHGRQETASSSSEYLRLKQIPTGELISSIEKECSSWLETLANIKAGKVKESYVHEYLNMYLADTVHKFQTFFDFPPRAPPFQNPYCPPQADNQRPQGRNSPKKQHEMAPHGNQPIRSPGNLPSISPSEQITDLKKKIEQLEDNMKKERQLNVKAIESIDKSREYLNRKVKELEEEKRQLLTRLSAVVGEKLCRNNPDIADLSDPNRPTKIGEQFSELYDNEWTDAFDELSKVGYTEREAIDTLRLTLESTFTFCREKSETLISSVESVAMQLFTDEDHPAQKSMTLCMKKESPAMLRREVSEISIEKFKLQARWKPKAGSKASMDSTAIEKKPSNKEYDFEGKLKQLRKEVGLAMIPMVQKAYMKEMWRSGEHLASLKPYIRKCLRVCWFMVVQTPPMCIELGDLHDQKFEKDRFKAYTCEGQQIDYVVWPPLSLHHKGPLVAKGIAQGIRPVSSGISKQ